MIQSLDRAHFECLVSQPDAAERIERWVIELIEERDRYKVLADAAAAGWVSLQRKGQ